MPRFRSGRKKPPPPPVPAAPEPPPPPGADRPGQESWWLEAFPAVPYAKNQIPGEDQMLTIVAYDIAAPKRLGKVARLCEEFGLRVQYSIFECHLTEEEFDELWLRLLDLIDADEDRVVAYRLDAKAAKRTMTAGTMVCSEKVVCYFA